ncbi:MAG TPA: hypothetical protein VNR89_13915 [Roseomonas sp.]|nr:hypothetical protein [Roseomonas sp.]
MTVGDRAGEEEDDGRQGRHGCPARRRSNGQEKLESGEIPSPGFFLFT